MMPQRSVTRRSRCAGEVERPALLDRIVPRHDGLDHAGVLALVIFADFRHQGRNISPGGLKSTDGIVDRSGVERRQIALNVDDDVVLAVPVEA